MTPQSKEDFARHKWQRGAQARPPSEVSWPLSERHIFENLPPADN